MDENPHKYFGGQKMNRISAIYDLFAFGEDMGALRVAYNAMARRELLNKDVDQTMDYLKSKYNTTSNKTEFITTVIKEEQVNVQIETATGVVDSKNIRELDSHLGQGYNEYVKAKGVFYWTL